MRPFLYADKGQLKESGGNSNLLWKQAWFERQPARMRILHIQGFELQQFTLQYLLSELCDAGGDNKEDTIVPQ